MTTHPPTLPGRLLKRLVPAQDHESLLGDLSEEYQRGRSTTWYFLQILAAVVVGSWKDVRAHRLVALRAAVVGIATTLVLIPLELKLVDIVTGAGFMWGTTWIGLPRYFHYPYEAQWSYRALVESASVLRFVTTGWIVGRLHRRHGVTMVPAFLAGLVAFRIANLAMVPGPVVNFGWWAFAQSWSVEALWILLGGYAVTRREATA
jgi:hypothetical protein